MSRKIRLKRGNLADLPQLELGEPGVATDDGSLYIGTDRGNVRLANQDDLDGVNQQLSEKPSLSYVSANLSELNSKIESAASGSPKGAYPTLAELQTALPNGESGVYVVTADGQWYFWNGTAWTAGGVYQDTQLSLSSVTTEKLGDLTRGKNQFNKHSVTHGFYVDRNTGGLVASNVNISSDFIAVKPNTQYTLTPGSYTVNINVAFFDSGRNMISGIGIRENLESHTFTTPAGTRLMRFSSSIDNVERMQLEEGTASTAYEEYYLYNPNLIKPHEFDPAFIESPAQISDGAVTLEKLSGLRRSRNLFNKNTVSNGYINRATGEVFEEGGNRSSDFIEIKGDTNYTISPKITVSAINIAFFDINRNFISGHQITRDAANQTFLTPGNAVFLRFSVGREDYENIQLEEGSTATAYEPYYKYIEGWSDPNQQERELQIDSPTQLNDGVVTLDKLASFKQSKNLFNKETVSMGYIDRKDGTVFEEGSNRSSDFIEVKPNTYYTLSPVVPTTFNIMFYDSERYPISSVQIAYSESNQTFLTHERATFLRFSAGRQYVDSIQLEEGTVATEYEPYYRYIVGLVEPRDESGTPAGYAETQLIYNRDSSGIEIFVPTDIQFQNRYMRYTLRKDVVPFTDGGTYQNADLWRLKETEYTELDEARESVLFREMVASQGAYECAIAIDGFPDFHGTYHGYELMKEAYVYLDGVKAGLDEIIRKPASDIVFVHNSDLIQQGTENEVIANVNRVYKFNQFGLELYQKYEWTKAFDRIKNAYITMLPIKRFATTGDPTSKQITDTVITDYDFREYDVSTDRHTTTISAQQPDVTRAHIFGTDSKYSATVEVDYKDDSVPNVFNVSPAEAYNKFYFSYGKDSPVAVGDVWEVKSKFDLRKTT